MIPWACLIVGAIFLPVGGVCLWYMIARSKRWAHFTASENEFWVRRGVPVKWAGACKNFEQGQGMIILMAFCVVVAVVLIVVALFLPYGHG